MRLMRCGCWLLALLAWPGGGLGQVSDDALLEQVQRRAWAFFDQQTDPLSGLTRDRAGNFAADSYTVASLAATGFQLAALTVAADRDWLPRDQAVARATRTLTFVRDRLRHEHGWLPHFVDQRSGARVWECEFSSIDTALFVCGALLAGDVLGGPVQELAQQLDERVDYRWMLAGGQLLSHGWTPERGFLPYRWDTYSEHLLLTLLALGAREPLGPELWRAWRREPWGAWGGHETYAGPLFVHLFPAAYLDWRGRRDCVTGRDCGALITAAARLNQAWCVAEGAAGRRAYGPTCWGLSATDTPTGYRALQPPPGRPLDDGTICPWSVAGALPLAPELCFPLLRALAADPATFGRYGFPAGLNRDRGWVAPDVIGIDLGAALLLLENHRSGLPWRRFAAIPRIARALRAADLQRPGDPPMRQTHVSLRGDDFLLNGQPTWPGRTFRGHRLEGLLFNSRMVQGIFDDRNPATVGQWAYPDGPYDRDRNTREFIAAMPLWQQHGLNAFTLNLQGGSPQGYSREQPWHNSAFDDDGHLRADYLPRLQAILDRADELGMVVILGYLYFGQEPRLTDEAAVCRAVDEATDWVLAGGYTNVLIEIANECNVRYRHAIVQPARCHELVERVRSRSAGRLLVSVSLGGGAIPPDNLLAASDFILLHGNGVGEPDRIRQMVDTVRSRPAYRGQPVVFNEDDHFAFDQPDHNFLAAVSRHASWGYFDYRMRGEGYAEGFQSVPVDWGLNSARKRGFFGLLREMVGR
ncbi:MAG: hypothetical protein IT204_12795 [Fimbriimonadaceae bacterium]|nr:hypothetical protein [Fimbriimonadaceae bacterium]